MNVKELINILGSKADAAVVVAEGRNVIGIEDAPEMHPDGVRLILEDIEATAEITEIDTASESVMSPADPDALEVIE